MTKRTEQSIFDQHMAVLKNAETHEEKVSALRPLFINFIKSEDRNGTDLSELIEIFESMAKDKGVELPTGQTAIIQEAIKRGWV